MKTTKLTFLAFGCTALFTLLGCGATSKTHDVSKVSTADSNKVSFGGYWWTYKDRHGTSTVTPYTGLIVPTDPASGLSPGIAKGNGIEPDETGNNAIHVTGAVGPAPKWTATLGTDPDPNKDGVDWRDVYWDQFYSSLCIGGACGEVAYPAAGLGFGFKDHNIPPDLTAYLGVAFRLKVGPTHALATDNTPQVVKVSLPMDNTDVPDPTFNDEFGVPAGTPIPLAGGKTLGTWAPACSFPQMDNGNGQAYGTAKTCFANYMTTINPSTVWTNYCLPWSSFAVPDWVGSAPVPPLNPAQITKLQWDAYQPPEPTTDNPNPPPVAFDIWVDDVYVLTCENVSTVCAAADPSVLAALQAACGGAQ